MDVKFKDAQYTSREFILNLLDFSRWAPLWSCTLLTQDFSGLKAQRIRIPAGKAYL